jgi:hypothetical protein
MRNDCFPPQVYSNTTALFPALPAFNTTSRPSSKSASVIVRWWLFGGTFFPLSWIVPASMALRAWAAVEEERQHSTKGKGKMKTHSSTPEDR